MPTTVNMTGRGDVTICVTYPHAGTPSDGASGTLAGLAGKGDMLYDTTGDVLYVNKGTNTSPSWKAVTTA